MKKSRVVFICFILSILSYESLVAQANYTLGFADSVTSTILKEERPLMIYTPFAGKKNRTTGSETYPVLYVLDGENNFRSVAAMVERLISTGSCPPMIVVGIPNTNRGRDLTPTAVLTGDDAIPGSGGGNNFMSFIAKELLPYMEANYPVSPYRLLMGHSLGGLMVIHTLVHKPDLFNAYISIDAALWWDGQKIVREFKSVPGENRFENKNLFMTMANRMEKGMDTAAVQLDTSGNTELIRYNLDLIHYLKLHPQNQLRLGYAYYENETHGTVSFISAYNALRFIFDYYAFPIDAEHQVTNPALASVIAEHYGNISKQLGYRVLPAASLVNSLGYRALNGKQFEAADRLFALNVLNYPGDANLQDSYGDYYLAIGDKQNAIKQFKKALSILEIVETRSKLNALIDAPELSEQIDALIEKAVSINRFNGSVLVARKGKIIYEKAYGYQDAAKQVPATFNTIYQIGSTTKEFTAAVILQLAEQHKLGLGDKLNKYFPDYPRGNEITIRHLLTHTSGIYEILRDHTAVMESSVSRSKDRMLSFFINKPLDFDPGTQYAYSNSGYIMLGLIIEKVTGLPYFQVVRDYILTPLGMKHTGFDFVNLKSTDKATGYNKYSQTIKEPSLTWDSTATYSAGSMYSTVEDLYKWHTGLLRYKVYNSASMEAATTPYLKGYGLGCWIDTIYNQKIVSHGGNILGFTGYFSRIQEEDVTVIILNNIYNHQIETIGLSIFAMLYDKPYTYFDELKLGADELDRYVGHYDVNPNYQVEITRTGNRLFIQRNREPLTEIFAYKKDIFFQKDDDIRVSFQATNGTIDRITIIEGLNTKKGDKIKNR